MKRLLLAVPDPWNYIDRVEGYSLMVVNPAENPRRLEYLIENSDYSIMLSEGETKYRNGSDYPDESLVLYTSGTTGDSKFYGFTKQQVQAQIYNIIRTYRITDNDRYLSVMPLHHAHGMLMYFAAKTANCDIKFMSATDLKSNIDFQPTFLSAIPDLLKILGKQKFTQLRFIRSASSALPTATYEYLKSTFGVPVIEAFGMTETCSHCFTNPLDGPWRIGTIGLPSGVEAKIEDGRLYLQGQSIYRTGWIDTGDLAEQDSAGYYKILGRAVDRLNIRGYKIDPLSIENQLRNRFADLGEVAVFGTNRLMCIYTGPVEPDLVRAELIAMHRVCSPKLLQQVNAIPKNTANKISRSMLAEIYQ